MPLKKLYLQNTMVTDLSPLKGLPIDSLYLSGTKVVDISPLEGSATLQKLTLAVQVKNFEFLRTLPRLEHLSFIEDVNVLLPNKTAAEFWKEYDAKKR
jgi:internalin A